MRVLSLINRGVVLLTIHAACVVVCAQDVSAPPILQWFEASYNTIEKRTPDLFLAGYGAAYLPPTGRADSGNQSVGYDVYDRFDLGRGGNPTLYGTERGLKTTVKALQKTGGSVYIDFILNHSGFRDSSSPGFVAQGDYPGFVTTLQNAVDGDYHSAFASGDQQMRLAGLIDIDQRTNNSFIRNPVPGFANNIPAGTVADIPDENNRRFYPDKNLQPIMVFDPTTGEQNIAIYPFNNANPMAGDPVEENAMGYLMRHAQWMVQNVGVDGFRLDAAKHVYPFALNYFDRAVYRSSFRTNLDGSQRQIFSFQEVFDGSKSFLQTYIRKDINPADPGRVGGNRDVLDFPLFFALRDNLTNNGAVNNWHNIRNASIDSQDDGNANNGSQGVAFVISHDDGGAYMSNVAHAFVLMRPGNVNVYHNAHEFGTNRDFPKDGRGDALGGFYGDAITKLLSIRNSYGRGNFKERWIDQPGGGFSNIYAYERSNSAIVGLNSRNDGGFDERGPMNTDFDPGTHLVELTGNATSATVDPFNEIPDTLVVNGSRQVTIRIPRNKNTNGVEHGKGYVIYGPATPQGTLSLTNVSQTIAGETPTANTNGTARLASIDVVTANSFQVQLNTTAMTLSDGFRDRDADGDNALLKIDDGFDANGNGTPDIPNPTSTHYGFENFLTLKSPGYNANNGNGSYQQNVNAANLSEGMHYLTVRAFRHRANGPAIFSDFKKVIYVDRLKPVSAIDSFDPIVPGIQQNRRLTVSNTDLTGNNVHVFFDLPASLTDAQVLAMVGANSQSNRFDRDLWTKDATNLTSGNHVATVVTYEMTGNNNVQRFGALAVAGPNGAGLGDLNFNNTYAPDDVSLFSTVFNSNNTQFNPAADLDGDGRVQENDLLLLGPRYTAVGASAATRQAYNNLLINPSGARTVFEPLDNSFGSALSKTSTGTINISGFQKHGTGASLSVSAGTVNINTDAGRPGPFGAGPNLQLSVSNTAQVNFTVEQNIKSLNVSGGTLTTNSLIDTSSLFISGSGVVDLGSGAMIVRPGNIDGITDYIRRARAGGSWTGTGLTSSAARADAGHLTTLGVVANTTQPNGQPRFTSFLDHRVDGGDVLIRYTLLGDLDLDLDIDADDYAMIDFGYANHLSRYQFGDLNLDGAINSDDYFYMDLGFSNQGSVLSQSIPTSVPEPSVMALILLGLALVLRAPRASRP